MQADMVEEEGATEVAVDTVAVAEAMLEEEVEDTAAAILVAAAVTSAGDR